MRARLLRLILLTVALGALLAPAAQAARNLDVGIADDAAVLWSPTAPASGLRFVDDRGRERRRGARRVLCV
jgi:hypothetical protein